METIKDKKFYAFYKKDCPELTGIYESWDEIVEIQKDPKMKFTTKAKSFYSESACYQWLDQQEILARQPLQSTFRPYTPGKKKRSDRDEKAVVASKKIKTRKPVAVESEESDEK